MLCEEERRGWVQLHKNKVRLMARWVVAGDRRTHLLVLLWGDGSDVAVRESTCDPEITREFAP